MSPDTIQLLAIASAVILGIFVCQYFRYRTAVAQSKLRTQEAAGAETKQLRTELVALRERVEVLEKIVTDSRYDLRTKIANL